MEERVERNTNHWPARVDCVAYPQVLKVAKCIRINNEIKNGGMIIAFQGAKIDSSGSRFPLRTRMLTYLAACE